MGSCSVLKARRPAHPPLDLQRLTAISVIERELRTRPGAALAVRTHRGNLAHAVRVPNVLYLPDLGLHVVGNGLVPTEGIGDAWNLGHLQRAFARQADAQGDPPYATPFDTRRIDEDVCILSNMFSWNFCHFTEELFKVVILERAGVAPRYVYTDMPAFAADYLDALGIDRRRWLHIPREPVIFRSVLYTTPLTFGDLSPCPDIFFELRERLFAAIAGIRSPHGPRLWLDRGCTVAHAERDLVNPDEIDECLDAYEVRRLDIGSLPLLEQIAAARDADLIAGPHGAAFTHSMFMQPRSAVIEVFSPLYLNHCWTDVYRVLNLRYAMVADANAPHCPYAFGTRVHVGPALLRLALQSLT